VHLVKSAQDVGLLGHFPKPWQASLHFQWQVQYKRHVHQSCEEVRALISLEGLRFGASDLQVC